MDFLIADTFTDSLAKLTGDEQKAVKTTAFDLQMNPVNSGMSLHKLDKAKDKNFWSVRVSGDIRLIIHKTAGSLLLCYVDHHDRAYDWAERRRLEAHPKTGAAQLVEIRETVKEIVVPVYVQAELPMPPKPRLFADASDDELLGYGVPTEWLNDVRQSTEDSLLGDNQRPRLDQHHAPGQGPGVPCRRGDGLRRRNRPFAGTHRDGRRRGGLAGGL